MSAAKRMTPRQRVSNYLGVSMVLTPEEALAKLTPKQRRRVLQKARGRSDIRRDGKGRLW